MLLRTLKKVQGAFFNSGQYQIIFGTGTVNKIYDEVVALGLPTSSKDEMKAEAAKQGNWFQRAIRTFGDVLFQFTSDRCDWIVYGDSYVLLLKTRFWLCLAQQQMHLKRQISILKFLTDTAFCILPRLGCWSAFRVFGGNPIIGLVLGLMMVNSALPNAWACGEPQNLQLIHQRYSRSNRCYECFRSIEIHWKCSSNQSPSNLFLRLYSCCRISKFCSSCLFVGLFGAKFEKWLHKKIPDVLDLLLVPFLTFLVMSVLGLFAIGPVFHIVEEYVLGATKFLLGLPFGLAGLILGGVHQLIVVTGVHHIFNLLEAQLVSQTGKDAFNAIITAAMTAQAGATLAVGVKTKSKN